MGLTMGLAVSMMCLHSCSVKKEWYRKARGCQDRASTLEACSQEFGCAFQCMVRLSNPSDTCRCLHLQCVQCQRLSHQPVLPSAVCPALTAPAAWRMPQSADCMVSSGL